MISRGYFSAALAALACSSSVFAQLKMPHAAQTMPGAHRIARNVNPSTASQQQRILWIRNDQTGQVITPGATQSGRRAAAQDPVFIYNNYENPNGIAGINLNWTYKEAYSDNEFTPPTGGDRLDFLSLNISSDPTDPDDQFQVVGGEKLSLIFEPYRAEASTWPVADLNERQPITEYTSVVSSYSEQFEIRICRIYFFSLTDVNEPFHATDNPYALELQLSFAFVSFAFQSVESPFTFNLDGFDPPLKIKGDGLILTHWKKLSQPPNCPGDFNEDGLVDDIDFLTFFPQYNVLDCADENMPDFCSADLDFDGFVDDEDYVVFIRGYNDLLCPAPYVIRKVFAPLAGGRFRWDNDLNYPEFAPPTEAIVHPDGWPFPNSFVTVPNLGAGPYPSSPDLGCAAFLCQPSFLMYFSTLSGFHTVNELNMEAEDLKTEYERFLNQIAGDTTPFTGTLRPYPILSTESFIEGGLPGTDWLPSSTPKRISITPLEVAPAR